MKHTVFILLLFVTNLLCAQTLFKGDADDINRRTDLKIIPAINVWDSEARPSTLDRYLANNNDHKGKPTALVFWNRYDNTAQKITDLANSGLLNNYRVVTIFVSTGKTGAELKDALDEARSHAGVENKWGGFLVLTANWEDVFYYLHMKNYAMLVYVDEKQNIVDVTGIGKPEDIKLSLENIAAGKITGPKHWYTAGQALVPDTDPAAAFYIQVTQEGQRVEYIVGKKEGIVTHVQYVKKGRDYLNDGVLESWGENKTARAAGNFKDGLPVSTYKTWHPNGKLSQSYPLNGTFEQFDQYGELMVQGPVKNGYWDGLFTYYTHGIKKSEVYWSPKYENAHSELTDGLQSVRLNGLYGYVNRDGELVIPFKYTYALPFREGKAKVAIDNDSFEIDRSGKRLE